MSLFGFQMSYKVDRKQLEALQSLSSEAAQNIFIFGNAKNHQINRTEQFSKPISLLGYNDAVISPKNSKFLRYQITESQAQVGEE